MTYPRIGNSYRPATLPSAPLENHTAIGHHGRYAGRKQLFYSRAQPVGEAASLAACSVRALSKKVVCLRYNTPLLV